MKDLIILTDKPITHDSCTNEIKNTFKSLILRADTDDYLYLKKSNHGFEIWFSPEDVLDDPKSMMEETIERCPNKKAYLTNISYTSINIAAKIVSLLKPHYGNMWIQSDEEDDWFGTADEFIDIYCKQYKQ